MLSICALTVLLAQTPMVASSEVSLEPVVEVESGVMEGLLVGLGTGSPIADINGDGQINFFDIVAFIDCLNTGALCADLNGDGLVNFFDIQLFIAA